jgi:DNA-binding transcriptional regulator YhcF (GntR family)
MLRAARGASTPACCLLSPARGRCSSTEAVVILRSLHPVDRLERLLMLRILGGEFQASGALPSQRELAREHRLCRNTVAAAVGRLAARGLCSTRTGVGSRPARLAESVDHRMLSELLDQACELARAVQLVNRALDVVRKALREAALRATACQGWMSRARDATLTRWSGVSLGAASLLETPETNAGSLKPATGPPHHEGRRGPVRGWRVPGVASPAQRLTS